MVAITTEELVAYKLGLAHGVIGIAKLTMDKLGYEGVGVPVEPGRPVWRSQEVLDQHVLRHYRDGDAYRDAYFDKNIRESFDFGVKIGGIPPFLAKVR